MPCQIPHRQQNRYSCRQHTCRDFIAVVKIPAVQSLTKLEVANLPCHCLSCIRLCASCTSILSQILHKQMQKLINATHVRVEVNENQCSHKALQVIWGLHCAYCQHDVQEPSASTSARVPSSPVPPKRSPLYTNSTMYGQQVRLSALPKTPGVNTSVSINLCVCEIMTSNCATARLPVHHCN